jgi:hypothetical protein
LEIKGGVVSKELHESSQEHTCSQEGYGHNHVPSEQRLILPDSLEKCQHRNGASAIHQEEASYTFA